MDVTVIKSVTPSIAEEVMEYKMDIGCGAYVDIYRSDGSIQPTDRTSTFY